MEVGENSKACNWGVWERFVTAMDSVEDQHSMPEKATLNPER